MFVVSAIGDRNVLAVPLLPLTPLVTTEQQDRSSLRVEDEQDPHLAAAG